MYSPIPIVRIICTLLISKLMWTLSMDVKPRKELYLPDYHTYHDLEHIYTELSSLSHATIHINQTFKSRHKRPQYVVRFTNLTSTRLKPKILIVSGQHSREFFPVESILSLIKNITHGLTVSKNREERLFSKYVVNFLDLYIVPMLNPDGREYVESKKNYCWRGTATGVDLERNFDWNYGGPGSSANAEDEEYRGTGPFSEPECRVLLDITHSVQFDAFLSLHSGTKQIYAPFADTKSKKLLRRPVNVSAMLKLAALMSASPHKEKFTYGPAGELSDYSADGTVFDYMAGVKEIPFSLKVELWGSGSSRDATCFDVYNPASQDLKSAITDVHPIYETLFMFMVRWKRDQLRRKSYLALRHDEPSLTLGLILLCLVVLVTLIYTIQHRLPWWFHIFPRRRVVSLRTLSSTFYPYRTVHKA